MAGPGVGIGSTRSSALSCANDTQRHGNVATQFYHNALPTSLQRISTRVSQRFCQRVQLESNAALQTKKRAVGEKLLDIVVRR
jgi:hypothetical protein